VRAQRIIHWTGVATFTVLLVTGIALTVSPLSFLAAGGIGRWIHRIAAFPFIALPIAYAVLMPHEAKELVVESLTFTADDWRWLKRLPGYLLGSTEGLPPQGRINAGQKVHHASTVGMFVTVAASGFVLWLGKGALGAAALGWTALVHDLSVLGLTILAMGHVYFTFLYDALSAMRTGYVTEEYARLEHRRWFESMPKSPPSPPNPS
jgi:formate dehydrogenase subunit gamma